MGAGTHTSVYQNGGVNAAPYTQGYGGSHSVHVGGAAPLRSNYQQSSVMLSKTSGGAFKKRLNSFLDDDSDVDAETAEIAANAATAGATDLEDGPMSKNDMLKQAKDKKKIAKANLKNKF